MSQAKPNASQPAMERLNELAAGLAETLPAADPADGELLQICSDILELRAAEAAFRRSIVRYPLLGTPEQARMHAELDGFKAAMRPLMASVGRLPATTPAGLFAKAKIVKSARGSGSKLSESLATDLLSNANLRRLLWPAAAGDAA